MAQPSNDNTKWRGFDEAMRLIALLGDGDEWVIYRRIFYGVVSPDRDRSADNIYWFLRFDRSFKDSEVKAKRDAMRLA